MQALYVASAGVVGVLLRYTATLVVPRVVGSGFPWGTLLVNVLGSFAIGVVAMLGFEKAAISDTVRIALIVGLLGGFTTFSSFSLETVLMLQGGQWLHALAYSTLSLVLCLGATALGLRL